MKKLIIFLLIPILILCLFACKTGESTTSDTRADTQTDNPRQTGTAADDTDTTQPESTTDGAPGTEPEPVKGSDNLGISEYDDRVIITGAGSCEDKELIIPSHINGKPVTDIDECAFQENKEIKSVFIPYTVKRIDEDAFAGCENLEKVTFSEGLEYLIESSFYGCTSLKSVTLPSTLFSVGSYVFSHCSGLEEVIMLGCADIRSNAFDDCTSLKSFEMKCGAEKSYKVFDTAFTGCYAVEKVVFAPGLTEMGNWNFADTANLKYVFLPKTLTKISACTFLRSGIETVNYEGSEEEWNKIEIKEPLFTPNVIYNCEYTK